MRRRDCLFAQGAHSLLAAWTTTHTRGYRGINTLASAAAATAAATGTTPGEAPTQGEGNGSSEGSASTMVAEIRKPSVLAEVKRASRSGEDGSLETVTSSSATVTSGEAVWEATERLRAALRVLSVIEQAKSDGKKLRLSHLMEEVSPVEVEPESDDPPLGDAKDDPQRSTTPSSAATEKPCMGHGSSIKAAPGSSTFTAAAAVAPSVSWASATSSWIRNKQPKFWAIVNDAGAEEDAAGGVSTRRKGKWRDAKTPRVKSIAESTAPLPLKFTAHSTEGEDSAPSKAVGPSMPSPSLPAKEDASTHAAEEAKLQFTTDTAAAMPLPSSFPKSDKPSVSTSDTSLHRPAQVSAQSIRVASSVPPFRSRYKRDVAHALSELLNRDPELGPQLLSQLSAESRRLMLIMGTASEYYGVDYGEVAGQIKEADTDRDNSISSKEFDAWVDSMAGLVSTRQHNAPAKTEVGDGKHPSHSLRSPLSSSPSANAAAGVTGTQTVRDQGGCVPIPLPSIAERPAAAQASPTSPKAAVPSPLPLQSGASTHATTATSGPSPHPMASAAAISRQQAEMDVSAARTASARIIEVMQKSAAASPSLASSAAATIKALSRTEMAKPPPTPLPSPSQAVQTQTQEKLQGQQPVQESSMSAKTVAAASPGPAGPTASAPHSTAAFNVAHTPSTKCVDAPPVSTAFTNAATASTAVKETPKVKKGDPAYIPWPTFAKVVLAAAPPFLAFGMLDNCTLVLAGGAIDNILSARLGLTQMAAASLGGVVSGVAGIQVHGLAERFTRAKPPQLTAEQERSDTYLRAKNLGDTLGMVVGLILGMTPLLFMGRSPQATEEEEAENKRFREEAARSHQRQCKKVVRAEAQARQALEGEGHAAYAAMAKAKAFAAKPVASA
ncbi:hypothetical protein ABL78_6831 [Leptomonas seymouri]|uniref:EF-hand domain-containing protein n=1 Tax=Leptomonas seymouri TaxID=5684 RepID=A0A0N1I1G4_LEPSE|nr:hypothetical protein ABL78_6831 [Leptomonas seymouri]|eukprot:KPI84115.1 hypothetical protein ABL78_6831 [Leptomonas seymouri]